jgi:hypothetical protein
MSFWGPAQRWGELVLHQMASDYNNLVLLRVTYEGFDRLSCHVGTVILDPMRGFVRAVSSPGRSISESQVGWILFWQGSPTP